MSHSAVVHYLDFFSFHVMDWTLCIVCQQQILEAVRCPLNTDGSGDKHEAYSSFLSNVNEFRKLNQLPVQLSFGQEMDVDQLVRNKAMWHKSCHLKFNASKLQRARKRERGDTV